MNSVLDRLVHASATDAVARFRHRVFLVSHLFGGTIGLLTIPVYLVLSGVPIAGEAWAFAWLGTPLLLTAYLSRTGKLVIAENASIALLTSLVAMSAWETGGLASPLIGWFIPVLLLAALSGRRHALLDAASLVISAVALLGLAQLMRAAPPLSLSTPLWAITLSIAAMICIVYAAKVTSGLDEANAQAMKSLREEDARYRLLAENATDLITRHTRSGNVLFASPAAQDLLGAASDELINDGMFTRVHVADRPAFLSVFSQAAERSATATVEFRIRKSIDRHGPPDWRWVEMRCRRFDEDTANDAVQLIAITRDIEVHRRQEEALRSANALAEKASEAKTRFLANMSHELRTPLNAIIGFSEMLTLDMPVKAPPERVVEYAHLINESGRHLLEVVNSILDMSKLEAGSFAITREPFDGKALVESTVAMMAPMAKKAGVILTAGPTIDGREITADRRACKQILLNLLSNAVKFTRGGGEVGVSLAYDNSHAYFTVRDTGVGIDEKDLPTLATPFVQAQSSYDRRYEGTGLGLSVVKGLVELHGGELTIRSKLGVGTTVTVRLPMNADELHSNIEPFVQAAAKVDVQSSKRRKSIA